MPWWNTGVRLLNQILAGIPPRHYNGATLRCAFKRRVDQPRAANSKRLRKGPTNFS